MARQPTFRRFTAAGVNQIHPLLIIHAMEIEAARYPDPAIHSRGVKWTKRMMCDAIVPLRVVEHESWHAQPVEQRAENIPDGGSAFVEHGEAV